MTTRALADWNAFIECRRLKREADYLRKRTQWLEAELEARANATLAVLVVVAAVAVALGMSVMWWALK